MRPHHGREEVHPGCWKGKESNNNGAGATDTLLTKERKYSNPNGISKDQEEDPSSREELAQANNGTQIRTISPAATQKPRTRAPDVQASNTLHRHERKEPQNKSSTIKEERKEYKRSSLTKGEQRTLYHTKAWRKNHLKERSTDARS